MLIAISIFALVLIAITNVYLIFNNSQRKIVTLQKIQEDVRFLFDSIAQDIRLGSINYDYYQTNGIGIHPNRDGLNNSLLALIDQSGEQIFYNWNETTYKLQYCSGDCDLGNSADWENITPEQVEIVDLKFIIYPSADPFKEVAEEACTGNSQCETSGYVCNAGFCKYFSDGQNFQPKVLFSIKSRGVEQKIAQESELIMQSTISTRIFSSQIKNLNYD